MRFHIGLSLNWKTLKKWILPILIGILLFLGLSSVNALDLSNYKTPTSLLIETHNPLTGGWSQSNCTSSDSYCYLTLRGSHLSSFGGRYQIYQQFDTSKEYSFTIAYSVFDTQVGDVTACGLINKDYTPQVTYSQNGSSWTVADVSSSNCFIDDTGWAIHTFVFKPTISTINYIAFKFSYTGSPYFINNETEINVLNGIQWKSYTDYDSIIVDQNDTIINQNQQTNDKLDNLEDSLTNPDIESGTGNDFFDNFQTEDNGGISGIITAPLTLINSLLDGQGTCTDLKFPIMGKEVSLPSGCIIWDKVPNEMEVLIQTLVCGTGAYFLLRQLFKDIEKLKNPNNSEVSTLDL